MLMNNFCTATLEDIRNATGSAYCYSYEELPRQADLAVIQSYCSDRRALFAPIAKAFDVDANSHWILRHYLAIKFSTAANMLAGSAAYAYEHNLMLGVPYFNYYAVLNACRAFLLTSPQVAWQGERTVKMTHQNILNRTADYMRSLNPGRRQEWCTQLEDLREHRELFSYRFPLSGPELAGDRALDVEAATSLGRLIAELASLNSECLDAALCKHSSMELSVRSINDHDWATAYELAGVPKRDPSDQFRLRKYVQGWKTVAPLQVMTTDGLLDDVYGTWCDPDDRPGMFDPDDSSKLILAL
ncbi:hypothetical protein KDW63_15015 [Burkholderia cenocepacia]|uniref:hypothetical protein n=1 Tax=Burkholderia cenocepacia TaxID=95486 RepID=UPI001BA159DD|nr:hypothetical protein [Burkholderia cenocepacia]MBR8295492.1 hypothetical protein [Burkholderia cenocepacia]